MNFYSRYIFPWIIEWGMSDSVLKQYRQQLLSEVEGEILEIGFGTGLNLLYYPKEVSKITAIDANPGMNKLAAKRINDSHVYVDYQVLNSEKLPMADASYDSVVSTWTLCSIAAIDQAISEIYRVLKPGGKFYFIEHGWSKDPGIQTWQNRLNPIQKVVADGCHLNRNIGQIVAEHFNNLTVEEFYAPNTPKTHGYMYQGVASR